MSDRPDHSPFGTLRTLIVRIVRFGIVSALGLALDYAVYVLLVHDGLAAGWAYLIGASVGVTFVFVVSVRHVFESSHGFRFSLFGIYCGFQAVSIAAGAGVVGLLEGQLGVEYVLAKTLVLPFTFGTNFLFMSWLLSDRGPAGRLARTAPTT